MTNVEYEKAEKAALNGAFWVPSFKLDELASKINHLQKKAIKVGALPITFTITGETEKRILKYVTDPLDPFGKGTPIYREYTKIVVKGEAPKFSGWRLIARLLHDSQTGIQGATIVNAVPGESVPAEYRTSGCKCDHCNKNWVVRKDTYVVKRDSGETKQVGSTCIADFLGHKNPEEVAKLYSFYAEVSAFCGGAYDEEGWDEPHSLFVRGAIMLDLVNTLEMVASYHRVFGWITRKQAQDRGDCFPSSEVVSDLLLTEKPSKDQLEMLAKLTLTDADKAKAAAAIAWAAALNPGTDSDFEHNIRAVAQSGVVSHRTLGIGCAIIGAWQRAQEREANKSLNAANAHHVGTVGERSVFTNLTVVSVRTFDEGMYGPRVLHRFVDEDGAILTWWTGREAFEAKEVVCVKASVKRHSEYKGTAQTELSRVTEVANAEQAAILAALLPATETLLSKVYAQTKGVNACLVPEAEFEAARSELEAHGWCDSEGNWTLSDAAARLVCFAKARKSKSQKSAEAKAKKLAKDAAEVPTAA